jgi:hypothetical protein
MLVIIHPCFTVKTLLKVQKGRGALGAAHGVEGEHHPTTATIQASHGHLPIDLSLGHGWATVQCSKAQ